MSDRRGNVAAVLTVAVGLRTRRCCTNMTVKLTRGAGTARWSRQVIARPAIGAPAAAARPDGRMALGYPRRGRFWVRAGTVAGRLGSPIDAGPLGGNFRGGAVALGDNGTIAAAWQSGTYSRPWRQRAAVRQAPARRFARAAQLGYAASDNGTLFEGPPTALRIGPDNRVTVGFHAPNGTTSGRTRTMCVRSTAAGRFARPRPFSRDHPADSGGFAPMILGHAVSAAMMMVLPNSGELGRTLLAVGSGCRARSLHLLGPTAGHPVQAAVDARDRIWLLTQSQPTVDSRRPLMLTVTKRTR